MANTRELRRRIKSVKNTAQITKAMQMVAATKMRRAQNQALNGRPYTLNLGSSLKRLLPLVQIESDPLLQVNNSGGASGTKTAGIILLSTDKSLCGALNTNLFRMLNNSSLPSDTIFYTVGKKGRNFVAKSGKNLSADFENFDLVVFRQAKQLAKLVVEAFKKGELGEVYVAFPDFKSTLRQEPKLSKILPIRVEEIMEYVAEEEHQKDKLESKSYLFEPDPQTLLEYILLHHIDIKIYQAMLETKASEHSARMMAMQNATDNALELVSDLNLTYNQTRQSAITKELLEITTAQAAMN